MPPMNLPSLSYIEKNAKAAFHRFPYVLLCAALCAALSIVLIENKSEDFWFTKLLMAVGLGIPLFFSLTLYLEKPLPFFRPKPVALLLGGVALMTGFYLLSGDAPTQNFFLNYAQWGLAFHLLASFSPFLAKGEVNGFWQLNRSMFLRFCLSFLYAGVFFVGLALALGAMDHLLGVDVHEELYPELWIVSVFVLQTWHFTAGLPQDLRKLDRWDDYPNALKVFAQYMLVSLVVLYLVILYLYMGKILVQGVWPKGTVTWLVSFVSVLGMLTLLLLHPVQEKKENRWIKVFSRGFYLALLPLLVMLFLAVGKRIGQYGVTEQRYFVSALAVWILGIALYFLSTRSSNIKVIPLSLFAITLLTSFGPWGGYSTSQRSQTQRLKAHLVTAGLWDGAKAVKAKGEVPWEERKEISSILDYLVENHGVASVKGWFPADLSKWEDEKERTRYGYTNVSNEICKSLGFEHVSRWESKGTGTHFNHAPKGKGEGIEVKGYDLLVEMSWKNSYLLEGKTCAVTQVREQYRVGLPDGGTLVFDLEALLKRIESSPQALKKEALPPGLFVLEAQTKGYEGKFLFADLSGERKGKGTHFNRPQGHLLLRKKGAGP